jgi:hypothetical protein
MSSVTLINPDAGNDALTAGRPEPLPIPTESDWCLSVLETRIGVTASLLDPEVGLLFAGTADGKMASFDLEVCDACCSSSEWLVSSP